MTSPRENVQPARLAALRHVPGPSDVALAFDSAAAGSPNFTCAIFQSVQALYAIEELVESR